MAGMSQAPPALEPLESPELPRSVQVGLEMQRRGMQPPPQLQAVMQEMQNRGFIGQQAGSDEPFQMSGGAQQLRVNQRFDQVQDGHQAPSDEARAAFVNQGMADFMAGIERTALQSPRYADRPVSRIHSDEAGDRMTYGDRMKLLETLDPKQLDARRQHLTEQFDAMHSPEAAFVRQREEFGEQLLADYRERFPDATHAEAYRYRHQELARAGFMPEDSLAADALTDHGTLAKRHAEQFQQEHGDNRRQLSDIPYVGDFLAPVLNAPFKATGQVASLGAGLTAITAGALGLEEMQWGALGTQQMLAEGTDRLQRDMRLAPAQGVGLSRQIVATLGQFAGDMATIFLTRRPPASTLASVSAYYGLKEAGAQQNQIYRTLLDKGLDPREASYRATLGGLATGAAVALLERIPFAGYLRPGSSSRLRQAVQGVLREAPTEAAQELAAVMVELGVDANDNTAWENIARIMYSATVGGLGGGLAGGLIPDAARAGVQDEVERGNPIAQAWSGIDRAFRHLRQREQATTPGVQPVTEPGPDAGRGEAWVEPEQVKPQQVEPTGRKDPKILATPKQVASWYAKTFSDKPNAGAIEALASTAGERFRLAQVPVQLIHPNILGNGDAPRAESIDAISKLSDQEIGDLPPIIAIAEDNGTLQVIDGTHRLLGIQKRGTATIMAYVPESIARQIEQRGEAPVDRTREGQGRQDAEREVPPAPPVEQQPPTEQRPPDVAPPPPEVPAQGIEPEQAIEQWQAHRARPSTADETPLKRGRHRVPIERLQRQADVTMDRDQVLFYAEGEQHAPATVIEMADGRLIVDNGSHRIAAAIMRGETEVDVIVKRSEAGDTYTPSTEQQTEPEQQQQAPPTEQAEQEQPQPWANATVEEESRWFGTKVEVSPDLKGHDPYRGIVVRVLNGGTLIEVRPDGEDSSFRIPAKLVKVLEVEDSGMEIEGDQFEPGEPAEIEAAVRKVAPKAIDELQKLAEDREALFEFREQAPEPFTGHGLGDAPAGAWVNRMGDITGAKRNEVLQMLADDVALFQGTEHVEHMIAIGRSETDYSKPSYGVSLYARLTPAGKRAWEQRLKEHEEGQRETQAFGELVEQARQSMEPIDFGLWRMLHSFADASSRWDALRESGATDAQLREAIQREAGTGGFSGGPVSAESRGKTITVTAGDTKQVFSGKKLVEAVRRIMDIPNAQGPPDAVEQEQPDEPPKETRKGPGIGNPKRATTFTNLADGLQKQIDEKMNPGSAQQNPTARRARIIASMRQEGERLKRVQAALRGLARAHVDRVVPALLKDFTNRAQVETLLYANPDRPPQLETRKMHLNAMLEAGKGRKGIDKLRRELEDLEPPEGSTFVRLNTLQLDLLQTFARQNVEVEGIQTPWRMVKGELADAPRMDQAGISPGSVADAKRELLKLFDDAAMREAEQARREAAEKTERMRSRTAPGYFPTPPKVAQAMMMQADILHTDTVLEPSAGEGALLRMVEKTTPGIKREQIHAVELAHDLAEHLKAEGWDVQQGDFMALAAAGELPTVDKIVMNPPFEKGQDIEHVMAAFDLLEPGGRLVAVMSEGAFGRSDKKATAFREWLDELGGESARVEAGAFTGPDAIRQTGVATRIVTINKPQEQTDDVRPTEQAPTEAPPEAEAETETPPEVEQQADESDGAGTESGADESVESLTVEQAREIVDRHLFGGKTPKDEPGPNTAEGQARYKRALQVLNEQDTRREIDVKIRGVKLWFYPINTHMKPELQKQQLAEQKKVAKEIVKADQGRPAQGVRKWSGRRRGITPTKPTKPKDETTFLKRHLYKLQANEVEAVLVSEDGKTLQATDTQRAVWITKADGTWTEAGHYTIDKAGKLKRVDPEAGEVTPGTKRAHESLNAIFPAWEKDAGPAIEIELESTIRHLRQIEVMVSDNVYVTIPVMNPDGTLGWIIGDMSIGAAEVNVQDGYRRIAQDVGVNPKFLRDLLETAFALDASHAFIHMDTAEKNTPFILHAKGATSDMTAVLAPAEFKDTTMQKGIPAVQDVAKLESEWQAQTDAMEPDTSASPVKRASSSEVDHTPAQRGFDASTGKSTVAGSPAGTRRRGPAAGTGDRIPVANGYMLDMNPLGAAEGKYRRNNSDNARKITQSIAAARARRSAKAESPELDNIYRIVSDLARRFNLGPPGIGRARMLKTWAAGFYRIHPESIRLGRGSYVTTFVHELGHHLHKVMFPRAKHVKNGVFTAEDFPKAWGKDLIVLGKDLYGEREPNVGGYTSEGWAETVRFLVTKPGHLKQRTPALYKDVVTQLVTHHPEVWLALQDARVRLHNAITAGQINPIRQFVAYDKGPDTFSWQNLWDDIRIRLFDRYHRLQTFKSDLGIENLPAHVDPHIAALRANGHISGDLKLLIEHGPWDVDDPRKRAIGPGIAEILRPVQHDLELWQDYMIARRTLEKRAQGYEVLPQDSHIEEDITSTGAIRAFIKRVERDNPHFGDYFRERGGMKATGEKDPITGEDILERQEQADTVAARFREFNNWLITEYAVHHGLVTSDAAKLIVDKNMEYITFRQKKLEDATRARGKSPRVKFTGQTSGITRFREGMGEQIYPPLESFVSSMQGIISRANLNKVALNVVGYYEAGRPGVGRWIDRIDRPMDAMKVKADQLGSEILKQLGIGLDKDGEIILPPYLNDISEDALNELLDSLIGLQGATFWKPGNRTDQNNREVTVLVSGKPRFYEIKDARLFELLEGLGNPFGMNALVRLLRIPGRVLRAGATQLNPSFFIPNFMRDTMQAITMTDTDLSKLDQQARARFEGMKQSFLGGDMHALFLASGADMAGIFGEYYSPLTQKIDFDKMFESPRALGLVKGESGARIARDLATLGPVQRMNQAFEMTNRLGEFDIVYRQAIARGKGEAEATAMAGQAAADVTLDFQRGGTWSKSVNEVVPFFNAAMLGADKLGRFIRKDPLKALGRIFATMVLPSLAQLLLNLTNEDYWAKPLSSRDRYWFFPTGFDDGGRRTYLRIPKPYGLGAFSIATERSFAYLFGINPETGESGGDPGAFKDVGQSLLSELRPTINFAGIQPLLEVMSGDQGYSFFFDREIVSFADKDLPLGEQGAQRSSELARVLGSFMEYPPAKIDYLINGWFGGLGRDAVRVGVDPIISAVDPAAKQGEPVEFTDWLIIRSFMARQTRGGHEALTRFFDTHEHLTRINRGLKSREDDPQRYDEFEQRHGAELDLYSTYNRARGRMNHAFRELRHTYRQAGELDADELDRRVDELYAEIIEIARETHRARIEEERAR